MSSNAHSNSAKEFAEFWKDKGYEKGQSQAFWLSLLRDVLNIPHPEKFIDFEEQVKLDHTSFIDAYIRDTHVMIEQKSLGKNLRDGIRQSDGTLLSPFQQAKRYASELPYSLRPRWIVTCNFAEFLIYDMEQPNGEPEQIFLKDLPTEYYRLQFLVDKGNENIQREMQVSIEAGNLVGKLYSLILKQYKNPESHETLRSINILCVRLVFCLYAEDAGVFDTHDMFGKYLQQFQPKHVREELIKLFKVLDTKIEDRDLYMNDDLAAFPYVNGGLFSDETVEIPQFNEEICDELINHASFRFDWSGISPTIFGALFESTLNPVTRRTGGMHYTSIENIHKVIDPLFFDELKAEFEKIKATKQDKNKKIKLREFRQKLASLRFLDPAAGSGNFLTETFISLRKLENEALAEENKGQKLMGVEFEPILVNIGQFYGIEINDFAVTVARTALWIAESQMMKETEKLMQVDLDYLPLKSYSNIVEGNALKLDWRYLFGSSESDRTVVYAKQVNLIKADENQVNEPIVHYDEIDLYTKKLVKPEMPVKSLIGNHYDYILGNPPFVGYSLQSKEQKEDLLSVFVNEKGKAHKTAGKIDYVSGWYYKASQLIAGTNTKVAFVSTNSITQGEQVAALWKPLFEQFKIHIDFAHRTFRWDSESFLKAHVHCVIVGFSSTDDCKQSYLFDGDKVREVKNINAYLVEGPDVFVESRSKPLCKNVIPMITGNRPADGGHLIIEANEYEEFIKNEPNAAKYIKRLTGSEEYINGKKRYCLWLVGINPADLRKMHKVMKRVEACKEDRLKAPDPGRQKLALTPTLFREQINPAKYVIVPRVSSERRRYIPLGFLDESIIPTDSAVIITDASLYHFGILTSNVHMAWMRAVCGRLKSDYRYSKDIVYNNFPWPTPTDAQKAKIEQTAQAILDARALYPDSSLADLYDETTMPSELRKAHQANDCAVMTAYGFDYKTMTESSCVAELMKMYQKLLNPAK
ncbi:MAG: hypothetical protein BWY02_02180 [bacterium ADurb.Bin157]|nr:MAG: hypothetical protein BWY02_02180 [bacterium ADurb.Bin157]